MLKLNLKKKLRKIKKNTTKFNEIIKKQLDDGKIRDIGISRYIFDQMEECAGGNASSRATGYGSIDLNDLIKNKKLGGKRYCPQEQVELRKETEKEENNEKVPTV